MDEGLFITESSVRSKYDEDKITKLIIVINIYASKTEELTCLVQLLRPKWRKVTAYSMAKYFLKINRNATGSNAHKLMGSNILFLID